MLIAQSRLTALARTLLLRMRNILGLFSQWRRMLQMWFLYRRVAAPGHQRKERVLFWVPGGMPLMLHVEGAIAAALRLRGVEVHAVICDGPYRACTRRQVDDGVPVGEWSKLCRECRAETARVLTTMGIPFSAMGEYVSAEIRETLLDEAKTVGWDGLGKYCFRGVELGRNIRSAVIRYFRGRSPIGHEAIVKEYAFSALVVAEAANVAIDRWSPTRMFLSHGVYSDWGPALQVALARGIPVTGWMSSYLPARFYLRHVVDPVRVDFHNMSHQAWTRVAAGDFGADAKRRLEHFFEFRYQHGVTFDMEKLPLRRANREALRRELGVGFDRPVWGVMTHVNWDTAGDFSPMVYPSFDDWIVDTVRELIALDQIDWVIKIHPAEAWSNPDTGIHSLIEDNFSSLPKHVKLIGATAEISPRAFYDAIDGAVTAYGTAGLEVALLGKPVILAGEAHYGAKGFTYDAESAEGYRDLLRQVAHLTRLNAEQLDLARKYAHCYFVRRQIPLPVVTDDHSKWWRFQFEKRDLLRPGRDRFMDFVCDRLLDGKDFIMDDDLVGHSDKMLMERSAESLARLKVIEQEGRGEASGR